MKYVKFLGTLIVVVVTSAATTAVFHLLPINSPVGSSDIEYTDFLSVTLTALGLMLTVLGFFVAALGIIGWTTFESKLRDSSLSYLAAELSKDGNLRKEFEEIFTRMSLKGVESDSQLNPDGGDSAESPYND